MLHKFVVNLCVTPHVHASWRGVCWDKRLVPYGFPYCSYLSALLTCAIPPPRLLRRPAVCMRWSAHLFDTCGCDSRAVRATSYCIRSPFFRAHSLLQWRQFCSFSLLTLLNFLELAIARTLPCFSVELTVRTEVRHHHRRRRSVLFVDAVAARFSPRIDTGSVRRQPTTSLVSRARSPGAWPSVDPPPRPWVQRYEPGLVTSVVAQAVSTRQPTVTSATATCSGGVYVVAPPLRCSAAPLAALVTFTFYVWLSLCSLFQLLTARPFCVSLTVVPLDC